MMNCDSLFELSFHPSSTCPDELIAAVSPLGALGAVGRGVTLVAFSFSQLKLAIPPPAPFASITRRSTCAPADRLMPVLVIVVQFCHPPVSGATIGPVTSIPSISTWNVPPVCRLDRRRSRLYAPDCARFNVYSTHSP